MNKKILIISATVLLLLGACKGKDVPSIEPSSSEPEPFVEPYVDEARLFHMGANASKDITLRFFKEYQHIPYIDLSTYMKEFYFLELEKEINGDLYHYHVDSIKLDVNAANNTFTISDLDEICHLSQFDETVTYGQEYSVHTVDVEDKVFSFNEYDIELRKSDTEAYLPVVTLNNIFSWIFGYGISYNGHDLYAMNEFGDVYPNADYSEYTDYYSVLENKTTFYEDEARFNYSELCFSIDELTGHPLQMNMGKDELETKGLDALLDDYPALKFALKSTDKDTYLAGQMLFHDVLMYDGGHSGSLFEGSSDIALNIINADTKLMNKYNDRFSDSYNKVSAYQSAMVARNNAFNLNNDRMYWKSFNNSIAYIGFSSFDVDYEAWDNYYNNHGELPSDFTKDTFMFLKTMLDNTKALGNIKKIVIDLTTNGGGDVLALDAALSFLISGDICKNVKNTVNDNLHKIYTKIDRNLDGVFNELDNQTGYEDFNFAILTNKYSFSCGNAFPTVAKDNGIMIVGQQSGGGSCYVGVYNDACGVPYRVSGVNKLYNNSGVENDLGVPVDRALTYDVAYDPIQMTSIIATFYGE